MPTPDPEYNETPRLGDYERAEATPSVDGARRQEFTMGISEIIATRREAILATAARHGVTSIRAFGSVARGDARDDSDVDFLVEVGSRHSAFFPGGLVADLEAILGRRVDVVEPEGLHRLLKDRILREAVPV